MNSFVFNKLFPSALWSAITARLVGVTKMLLGVFCMTTQLTYKFTARIKSFLPLAFSYLIVSSFLMITSVFVTNQAEAHYISFKWNHRTNTPICPPPPGGGHNDERERCQHEDIITLDGTETSFPERKGTLRRPNDHRSAWEAELRWRIDTGAWESTSIVRAPAGNATTDPIISPYGQWVLKETSNNNASSVVDQIWTPNTSGIKSIPPGSTVEIELRSWQDGHGRQAAAVHNKLTIRHNTSATWNSSYRNTPDISRIAGMPSASTFGDDKLAQISTRESNFTNFSYESNYYLGSNAVVTNALTEQEVEMDWTGMEWAYDTPYGQWIVGNVTDCDGIKCQDVKFEPDVTGLNGVSGKLVLELKITLTDSGSGMVEETDSLIYVLNVPTLSITAVNDTINEGESAQFTVTSSINPGSSPIGVKVTPKNTSGNFIDASDGASGMTRTEMLEFTASQDQNNNTIYTDTFNVDTSAVDGDSPNGTITVELDPVSNLAAEINYSVDTTSDSATVTIKDVDVPIITIENAPSIVASQMAEFPLTASIQPHEGLTIRYLPTETGSNFLDPSGGTSGTEGATSTPVMFTEQGDGSGKGTLSIPTRIDTTASIANLIVELKADSTNAADPTYNIQGTALSNTKSVSIFAYPIRTISIEQDDVTIDEGESVEITFISDGDPEREDLPVSYTPTHSNEDFLLDDSDGNGSGDSRTASLNFKENIVTGKWEATITIETTANDNDYTPDGEIEVVLDDPGDSFYTIASNASDRNVTINVIDQTKPLIKISNGAELPSGSFRDNDKIKRPNFPLTSNHDNTVPIKYSITETGDFLDPVPTANEVRTADIGFSGGGSSKTGTLVITGVSDRNISNRSAITVTLVEDPDNYLLSDNLAERSGTVIVNDPSYLDVQDLDVNNVRDLITVITLISEIEVE